MDGNVMEMRVINRDETGGARLEFEGTEFSVNSLGQVGWMSDWGRALEFAARGVFGYTMTRGTFGGFEYHLKNQH